MGREQGRGGRRDEAEAIQNQIHNGTPPVTPLLRRLPPLGRMVQDLTHCKIPHHQTVHDMTDADMDTYAEAEPGSTCCALSSSSMAPIFGTSKAGSVVVVGVSHVDGPADGVSADPIDSRDRSARIMRPASAVRRLLAAACRLLGSGECNSSL